MSNQQTVFTLIDSYNDVQKSAICALLELARTCQRLGYDRLIDFGDYLICRIGQVLKENHDRGTTYATFDSVGCFRLLYEIAPLIASMVDDRFTQVRSAETDSLRESMLAYVLCGQVNTAFVGLLDPVALLVVDEEGDSPLVTCGRKFAL